MKKYIDKIKEVESLVESFIGSVMTEPKATDIYAITNDLMCMTKETCTWRKCDNGMYGCHDYEYMTTCGKNYDCDKTKIENYCPNCGKKIKEKEETFESIDKCPECLMIHGVHYSHCSKKR